MADDAGALLVRSGLVSANALEDARARVASQGGTLGEQLVIDEAVTDDQLTDFYCTRLLVPQVNPNALARLTPKIVAAIPSDMAIELRAIPVSFDADSNLTVAMSDPSDRHAVDEISFFTGVYVVRAVATQMQIAWCLAHYYGHVTALGQRLLRHSDSDSPIQAAIAAAAAAAAQRPPRTKGLTGKVNAARHRAIAPVTGPVDVLRPNSGELDLRPLAKDALVPPPPAATIPAGPASASPVAASRPGLARSSPAGLSAPPPVHPAATPPSTPASPAAALPRPSPASTPTIPGTRGAMTPSAPAPSSTRARSASAPAPASTRARSASAPAPASTRARSASAPAPASAPPRSASSLSAHTLRGVGGAPFVPAATEETGPNTAPALPKSLVGAEALASGMSLADGDSIASTASLAGAISAAGAANIAGAASAAGAFGVVPRAAPDAPTLPPINAAPAAAVPAAERGDAAGDAEPALDGALEAAGPDQQRTRSVSGEIRVPIRRAPSIRPPLPAPDDDDDEPLITIEKGAAGDDATGRRKLAPPRRRIVKSDPPELRARAGEVDLKESKERAIDADEPRIVIDEDALSPPTAPIDARAARETAPPLTMIDVVDDAERGALIHDRIIDRDAARESERESQPILLDRPRATPDQFESARPTARGMEAVSDEEDEEDEDTGEIIVMLDAKSQKHRPERHTQVGVPPAPIPVRVQREPGLASRTLVHLQAAPAAAPAPAASTAGGAASSATLLDALSEATPTAIPRMAFGQQETDRTADVVDDATKLDIQPAPPGDDTASDLIAAPPAPASDDDTNPHIIALPPQAGPAAEPTPTGLPAVPAFADHHEDDDLSGPRTSVMTAAELDSAIPHRTSEVLPAHLSRHRVDFDPMDDGWGPPGTTIPPPLLGAIPGSEVEDDESANAIPMPNIDSSPLMVGPPSLPPAGDAPGSSLVRALEDETSRAIEVIRELEHAQSRDQVVDVMISHLAETHHRAGFLVTRHATSKGAGELGLFAMMPRPAVMPFGTLRLDRPSTLQDVVGTRLAYRGPMHDDASRNFLVSILGACPPEILLVPVAVRERVVGVLFGEHRHRHTFDDQLALAARAAGMALERILKAKRG